MTHAIPKNPTVNLYDIAFGVKGDGSDDTAGWQAAVNAATARGGTLAVPPPKAGSVHSIRDTITVRPPSGTQARLSIQANVPIGGIGWEGANSKPIFDVRGIKGGEISGLDFQVYGSNIVVFEFTDDATYTSTTHMTLLNCGASFYTGSNNIFCRLGNYGTTDVSFYEFINTKVASDNSANGHIGFDSQNANVLNCLWRNGSTSYLGKAFTGVGGGGGCAFFDGWGGGYNLVDFELGSAGTYAIRNARFEHGQKFLLISAGATNPYAITVSAVELGSYDPTDGHIFDLVGIGSCSANLTIEGSRIFRPTAHGAAYTNEMIYGATSGAGVVHIVARNNFIRAADPFWNTPSGDCRITSENNTIIDGSSVVTGQFQTRRDSALGKEMWGTAAPGSGAFVVGDKVWNTAPAAAGNIGWVCTTSGSPGTWKTFGAVAA